MITSNTDRAACRRLRGECEAGVLRIYGPDPAANVRERLDHELGLIEARDWARGFLSVAAAVREVRGMGVLVGPGTGTSPSSLAYYLLGVSRIDPLEHGLFFERIFVHADGALTYHMGVPSLRAEAVAEALGAEPVSEREFRFEADGATVDVCGIEALDGIEAALAAVAASGGSVTSADNIPAGDPQTYDLLCSGSDFDATGLLTPGVREVLSGVQPRSLDRLAVAFALDRASSSGRLPDDAMPVRSVAWTTPTPDLDEITRSTGGKLLFEEQVMQASLLVGRLSAQRAEDLRQALAKHRSAVLATIRAEFMTGAEAGGCPKDVAQRVWQAIALSAGGALTCRAQAVSYALMAYWAAYLEAHQRL